MRALKVLRGVRLVVGGALLGFAVVGVFAPEASQIADYVGAGAGSTLALVLAKLHVLSI